MTQKIKKINIEYGNKTYEFIGSSLAPGESLPADTVDSAAIKDGTIQTEDLSDEVKDGLDELNNVSITDEEIEEIFYPRDNNGDADDEIGDDEDIDGDDDVDDEI